MVHWNLQVAKANGTTLPPPALFIIRYHSFYRKHFSSSSILLCKLVLILFPPNITASTYKLIALHREGAYKHLMNEEDHKGLKWLHIFK